MSDTFATLPRQRFAPALAATVATVLLLWLLGRTADIFLLLFVAILFSLYLGALSEAITRRTRLPASVAFFVGFLGTIGAVIGLVFLLVPPVVEQTQALVANLPRYRDAWQGWLERVLEKYPALRQVYAEESGKLVGTLVQQTEAALGQVLPRVVGLGHAVVNLVSILVMGIFLALYPGTYREWLIALFPPVRRDLVRDVLGDIGTTLRSWLVGQLLAMTILAILTAIGLYLLEVPYWLTFGVFTGAVAIIPFFGTLVSSTIPALFVLGGEGVFGLSPGAHAVFVMVLGFVIHIVEANLVVPLITQKQVEIPPVLSIMAVLIVGRMLGPAGLPVAVPLLATGIVLVRRILVNRIYEGQSLLRPGQDRVLVLRVPSADRGVIVTSDPPIDVLRFVEPTTRSA
ncbi:MAG: AI-2E family transporter [Gemmatimonadaceae bacterium]|nr:AI-2E family transporter [Gemmatimonadaceae bacterium]